MKAKLTREQVVNQDENGPITRKVRDEVIAKYIAGEITREQKTNALKRLASPGFVIDHPNAFRLVQLGLAEPADDECRRRAGMTDKQIEAAQLAAEKVENGQALPPELAHQNASDEEADAAKKTRRKRIKPATKS